MTDDNQTLGPHQGAGKIWIGTSGFSYQDWIGPVYPLGTKNEDMLRFYAGAFPLVELNFTYYAMPSRKTLASMMNKAGDRLLFSIKANKSMTHQVDDLEASCTKFKDGIAEVKARGRLACILHQFPTAFHNTPANTERLIRLFKEFEGWPQVVEFRHQSWLHDTTYSLLRNQQIGFCCVDEPKLPGLLPPVAPLTAAIAYIRFHGRNRDKWYNHEQAWERYNYLYSEAELAEWVPTIMAMAHSGANVMVLTNNHYLGQAFKNAQMLRDLIRRHGGIVEG